MRIRSFRHKGLEKFFTEGDPKGIPQAAAEKLRRMLTFLANMTEAPELRSLPHWKAHLYVRSKRRPYGRKQRAFLLQAPRVTLLVENWVAGRCRQGRRRYCGKSKAPRATAAHGALWASPAEIGDYGMGAPGRVEFVRNAQLAPDI